jgi:hypothetical protein
MHAIRHHLSEITGSAVSVFSSSFAIVSLWQQQISWALAVVATLIGITSGLLTIRSLLRKDKAEENIERKKTEE